MSINLSTYNQRVKGGRFTEKVFICSLTILVVFLTLQSTVDALWFFQEPLNQTLLVDQTAKQQISQPQFQQQTIQDSSKGYSVPGSQSITSYGSSLLSIAGIEPSRIASLLNTVGETGFSYFNIQDQCRNRAACDLGHMLYKKLSFVHNWLIRTSVRTLTDMNNIYTQSWMEGMLGRNCTAVYISCRQSPLEGLMNVAFLQHLAT